MHIKNYAMVSYNNTRFHLKDNVPQDRKYAQVLGVSVHAPAMFLLHSRAIIKVDKIILIVGLSCSLQSIFLVILRSKVGMAHFCESKS